MPTYISFLRGVNMTGHNSIKMADLSLLYHSLGFKENRTYIQSGNVIFRADQSISEEEISVKIEGAIKEKYGYNVPAMIRTSDEVKSLFLTNPYLDFQDFDPSKMAVVFLHEKITDIQLLKMRNINYPPDKYQITGREIFIYCPNGFGRTKLYTNFFEDKMGVKGTARNWKTINTILSMIESF
jgi:uncharacterized protein (DUF1697 family)